MILQANFHYEMDNKEKLVSISCKSGNEIFLALQKLIKDIYKAQIIYLDNTFQKIFAISIQKVELIKLPSKEEALENFIDLVFHISCQKGINAIAFHLANQEINNSTIGICKSEDILSQLNTVISQKDQNSQDESKKSNTCFIIADEDWKTQIKKFNQAYYGREDGIDQTQEDQQVYSIIIQHQNSNCISSCFLSNKNVIRVLSNFQITKAQLYDSDLKWSDKNNNIDKNNNSDNYKSKLLIAANVEKSNEIQNKLRFETILTLNHNLESQRHLVFVFNEKVIAFQFPLKFKKN